MRIRPPFCTSCSNNPAQTFAKAASSVSQSMFSSEWSSRVQGLPLCTRSSRRIRTPSRLPSLPKNSSASDFSLAFSAFRASFLASRSDAVTLASGSSAIVSPFSQASICFAAFFSSSGHSACSCMAFAALSFWCSFLIAFAKYRLAGSRKG